MGLDNKPLYTLRFWSPEIRVAYRQILTDDLRTLVRARLGNPFPNAIDTFRIPQTDGDDPWGLDLGRPTYFSEKTTADGSIYTIAYFVDQGQNKALVLTAADFMKAL